MKLGLHDYLVDILIPEHFGHDFTKELLMSMSIALYITLHYVTLLFCSPPIGASQWLTDYTSSITLTYVTYT
jgi:hypothetical protein